MSVARATIIAVAAALLSVIAPHAWATLHPILTQGAFRYSGFHFGLSGFGTGSF
jgi:hypothetical protein